MIQKVTYHILYPYIHSTIMADDDGHIILIGVPVTTFDGLKAALLADFELITAEDEPFVIRETRRKNQWTVSHVTVWKRRAISV
jgi:hypothetical protein